MAQIVKNLSTHVAAGSLEFDPWVSKIPYTGEWQPTPAEKGMNKGGPYTVIYDVISRKKQKPQTGTKQSMLSLWKKGGAMPTYTHTCVY